MIIVSCLGNPGNKYRRNRHNIGFIIGSHLASTWGIPVGKNAFSSIVGTGSVEGIDLCMMMPQTYMNNSGAAVRKVMDFYRVETSSLLVIHDDIELDFGVYKTKFGGGHKGQNGLRSIMEHLGTPDFHRFRFGVGRPDSPHLSVADHVLSDFSQEEMDTLSSLMPAITETLLAQLRAMT